MIRRIVIAGFVLFAFVLALEVAKPGARVAADAAAPAITLDASQAGPRQLEEQTEKSIARDYGLAWSTMQSALDRNDDRILDDYFAGIARDKLTQAVAEQRKTGVRVRYQVRSHALKVLFYSPEGSAIEARDTARLEMQVLDGGKVVHSETRTQPYLVLFTPDADRWKVRLLEPLPE